MDWAQVLTILAANAGLFLWARAESRADFRLVMSMIDAIQKEMKDFHGRLEKLDAEFKAHLLNQKDAK